MVQYLLHLARSLRGGGSPRWTVYGRRRHSERGRELTAGVHKEGFTSEDDAVAWLMQVVLRYLLVDAVVVRLDNGRDVNGERHVVKRVGQGKAWFE